jgi:hypothetical protein
MPRGGSVGPKRETSEGGVWSLQEQQQARGAGEWNQPGSLASPATSATQIRNSGNTTNGAYYYDLPSGVVQLWTDFNTWSSYSFVLVTRFSSADHYQYFTTANQQADLVSATTTAPSRSAKISDTDMNHIIVADTVKWVIGSSKQIFYRHNDSWTSNFGAVASCGYTTAYYSAYATPSNSPSWASFGSAAGACGGGQSTDWLILTGIHTNDANYKGVYVGNAPQNSTAPAAYTTGTGAGWHQPGYAFFSW